MEEITSKEKESLRIEKDISRGLKLSTAQIEAATRATAEIMEAEDKQDTINALTSLVMMKEKAIITLSDHLERYVCSLNRHGLSGASVAIVADGYLQAIRTASSQMMIFADQLSKVIKNEDMAQAYAHIVERAERDAEKLISTYVESQKKIFEDGESVFAEIYETYHNFINK